MLCPPVLVGFTVDLRICSSIVLDSTLQLRQFTLCLWKIVAVIIFFLQVCVKVHHPWYNQDNYSPFHNSYIPFKQDTWNVAIHRFIYWDKALLGSTTHCALQHLLAGLWHTPRPRGTPVVPCGFLCYIPKQSILSMPRILHQRSRIQSKSLQANQSIHENSLWAPCWISLFFS